MPLPQVHFAFGMALGSLAAPLLALLRRRWLVWAPVLMVGLGLYAVAPDLLEHADSLPRLYDMAAGREAPHPHAPAMDLFVLHRWLDAQPWANTPRANAAGFHAAAAFFLLVVAAFGFFIARRLPRMPEAGEALERLSRWVEPVRALGPVMVVAPMVLAGAALGWSVRTTRLPAAGGRGTAAWADLVARRTGLRPGAHLGFVRKVWRSGGRWLSGDLMAFSDLGGGSLPLAELLARARRNGCDFLVVADIAVLRSPQTPRQWLKALRQAAARTPKLAVLSGALCVGPAGERLLATGAPDPPTVEALAELARRFAASPLEALHWLAAEPKGRGVVAFAVPPEGRALASGPVGDWTAAAPQVAGLLALWQADKLSAREGRARWARGAVEPGGVWDELLDHGSSLRAAAAASGFRRRDGQFLPGQYAATRVWAEGNEPEDILAALRGGCFWCGEGQAVRSADLAISAGGLRRPARAGEVVWVAPGVEAIVELALEVPPHDFAGRKNALERVELVSNFSGRPAVVATFAAVAGRRLLTHSFPAARDANGGVGFYVRARGWSRPPGGPKLLFCTNPVRVLVHPGTPPPPPRPATRLARRPHRPWTAARPRPRTGVSAKPGAEAPRELKTIGLPVSVRPFVVETFRKPPGREWRGEHVSLAGDRGPALATSAGPIEMLQTVSLVQNTRLFFRCYARGPELLRVVARSSATAVPYVAARRLPQRQWVEFDLSLREDFLPARAGTGPIGPPARLEALEWRGSPEGARRGLFLTDVVLYGPTVASRAERARRRASQLELAVRNLRASEPAPSARQWLGAVTSRLDSWRAALGAGAPALPPARLDALERGLAALRREVALLRLRAATARAFGLPDPAFAVLAGPAVVRYRAGDVGAGALPTPEPFCEVAAAANEAESVQLLVVALRQALRSVQVRVSDLLPPGGKGPGLPASEVTAELVGELAVEPRAGLPPEAWGPVPDPLLPLRPFDVEPGSLRSVLLTVSVPPDLPPGNYEGVVTVAAERVRPMRLTLRLHRWDFALSGRHLEVVGPVDWRAVRSQSGPKEAPGPALRHELYTLMLSHRVGPTPFLAGAEEMDLAEVLWCLEHGEELAVLAQLDKRGPDPRLAAAAALARRLRERGWGKSAAVVLPRVSRGRGRERELRFVNETVRRYPALAVVSGGEGDAPAEFVAAYWRRPLGVEIPALPRDYQSLEVRRSRSTRLEAWELVGTALDAATPDVRLTNTLLEARVLPWLAWGHGVRALFLRGATGWGRGDLGGRVLVYPRPDGHVAGSLRLTALRDGAEDYEYQWLVWDRVRKLRARGSPSAEAFLVACEQLLADAEQAAGSLLEPCSEWEVLAGVRSRLGRQLERLEAAWWAEVDRADDLPGPVADLRATAGDGEVVLGWASAREGDVVGYEVYRSCVPDRGFARVNRRLVRGQGYRDRSVRNDRLYHYFVRASRRDGVEGRRSAIVHAAPTPRPYVVWMPMADLRAASVGPYRVRVVLRGPGTGNELPLVIPQLDYALGQKPYDGYEPMTLGRDGSWFHDVPDPGWATLAGRSLKVKVRIVDRRGREVAPGVERVERIEAGTNGEGAGQE